MDETESHSPLGSPTISPTTTSKPCSPAEHGMNLMVVLAAIVCAFLCALGLNTMLQCVFQCANRVLTEPLQWIASRRINSGLKKKEMVALPTQTYTNSGSPSSPSNCAICLVEFSDGDKIRSLPNCNHPFHVHCIDKWLISHSSCPTCRNFVKPTDSDHSLHVLVS
ncbi:RING-H2 finger protein ATL74 [Cajanus cajan]|uniref:RING-type E3 ubiquitin transferase n=1 Tax=Cajanus cajan TaxID=3821 RepID=A0A151T5K9_CAJCA|nr:RING-H2 finger protein ATL74 [Cajanus cajan]KYP62327.1 RING-H2 finger protein ATL5B [Cajanus cajan]